MTENDLYHRLKSRFPCIDWSRIETMTKSGIPDLNYCTNQGIEGWIELKIGLPRLKPSQVAWHTRAYANHRRSFILTCYGINYTLFRCNKFHAVDMTNFTPSNGCLLETDNLFNIIPFLTATY